MIDISRVLTTLATYSSFLTLLYLGYACMYLGPNNLVRRWGGTTWQRLGLMGPPALVPVTVARTVRGPRAIPRDPGVRMISRDVWTSRGKSARSSRVA